MGSCLLVNKVISTVMYCIYHREAACRARTYLHFCIMASMLWFNMPRNHGGHIGSSESSAVLENRDLTVTCSKTCFPPLSYAVHVSWL